MRTERAESGRRNLKPALRGAAESGRAFAVPGIFDPLGALLVEHLGFEAAFLGGWATGSHLGVTEPLMTMTETVDATARVTARTSLPLFVDAGTGWGEAVHVRRTVRELERAGAAVIQIEDQYFPKRMEYHAGIEDICDRAEFVHRVKTCVNARQSDDTLVMARTDATKARNGSVDEAVWRLNAALDAGADLVMPCINPAVVSLADMAVEEQRGRIREGLPDSACVVALSGYLPGQLPADGNIGYRVDAHPDMQALVESILPYDELLDIESAPTGAFTTPVVLPLPVLFGSRSAGVGVRSGRGGSSECGAPEVAGLVAVAASCRATPRPARREWVRRRPSAVARPG